MPGKVNGADHKNLSWEEVRGVRVRSVGWEGVPVRKERAREINADFVAFSTGMV